MSDMWHLVQRISQKATTQTDTKQPAVFLEVGLLMASQACSVVRVKVYLNSYNTQHLLLNPIQAQLHLLRELSPQTVLKDIMGLQGEHTVHCFSLSERNYFLRHQWSTVTW